MPPTPGSPFSGKAPIIAQRVGVEPTTPVLLVTALTASHYADAAHVMIGTDTQSVSIGAASPEVAERLAQAFTDLAGLLRGEARTPDLTVVR